ncbi:hypothetical protein BDR26DRAFT_850062 [Obelidium mucronatum]|nr:hypothetical protein BDR26DRAFT_850062 [Obelidium mucronatum]
MSTKVHSTHDISDTKLSINDTNSLELADQIEEYRGNLLAHSNELMDILVSLSGFALSSLGVTTFLMSSIGKYELLITASFFLHFVWLAGLTIQTMLTNNYICMLFHKAKKGQILKTQFEHDFAYFGNEESWMFYAQCVKWMTLCWYAFCQLLNLIYFAQSIWGKDVGASFSS